MKNFVNSNKINFIINVILIIAIILISLYCYILREKLSLIIQDQREYNKNYIPSASSTSYNYGLPVIPTLPTSIPLPQIYDVFGSPMISNAISPLYVSPSGKYATHTIEWQKEMEEINKQNEIISKKYQEDQIIYEDNKDKFIGCYYSVDNINDRIKLDRNSYFTKYIEGSSRFVSINGTYILAFDLKNIIFTPSDESKFTLKVDNRSDGLYLVENSNNFKKQTCADFNPY